MEFETRGECYDIVGVSEVICHLCHGFDSDVMICSLLSDYNFSACSVGRIVA